MARASNILVLGGGFGGLESAGYLRWKLKDALITLVSDQDHFLFRPNTIYIPFGNDPSRFMRPLGMAMNKRRIEFVHGRATEVDPDKKQVSVNGARLDYDYLIVSTGAGMSPEEVPGLSRFAQNIWSPEDMMRLRREFDRVVERSRQGEHTRVLFLVPPNNKCSGPLYEVVMMLDTWLRKRRARDPVTIVWSTYENGYIQAFGPELHTHVTSEFARRGISGYTEHAVQRVEEDRVVYANGNRLAYDLLVSFPPYVAAQRFSRLPADDRGFIRTDSETRQVTGIPEVFAVGDAGDFPVKQAFLAFLQADAVAENIVSMVQRRKASAVFVPNSLCVMEEYDKATYAQVPLAETGDPDRPVKVREDEAYPYRVGSSVAWRAGKWALGLWLPWRLGNVKPFHAGTLWSIGNVGLKGMSKLLSRKIKLEPRKEPGEIEEVEAA
ncbi:MAG: NAD(P)/FAD-dependent oxidoreductase [Actinobacteria bacterium]|nr:MAG: NAD(P)/FAD-dependent oxidoreductase [Actinomycetota bacterium]